MISIHSSSAKGIFVGCFVDFNNIFCIEYSSKQDNFEMKKLPIFDASGEECKLRKYFPKKIGEKMGKNFRKMNFRNSRYFYFLIYNNEVIVINRLTSKVDQKRFIDQKISSNVKMVDLATNNFFLMAGPDVFQLNVIDEIKNSWIHLVTLKRWF